MVEPCEVGLTSTVRLAMRLRTRGLPPPNLPSHARPRCVELDCEAMHAVDIATDLVEAFNAGDLDRMRELLAPDLVAWVTNADGEADRITGRDEYLSRIAAMDLPGARYRVTLTQSPAAIDEHLILLMVEVRAERDGRRLHNFAAHVLRVDEGRVTEWRMADAKPAESDQFWS
jgi:ketosteroid isomerase-like protein